MPDPNDVLASLRSGNSRFVEGQLSPRIDLAGERDSLTDGQAPPAMVLGCADSRVPPELIFDCKLGELFTVRVAGNLATPTQIGSLEYAAENLGSSLLVVLGHQGCGAVSATLGALDSGEPAPSEGLASLISEITPAVSAIEATDPATRLRAAIEASTRATVAAIPERSPILAARVASGDLRIMGADYDLVSGAVTFFE